MGAVLLLVMWSVLYLVKYSVNVISSNYLGLLVESSIGLKPKMRELITIIVLSAGGFESTYATILFFVIIGTC